MLLNVVNEDHLLDEKEISSAIRSMKNEVDADNLDVKGDYILYLYYIIRNYSSDSERQFLIQEFDQLAQSVFMKKNNINEFLINITRPAYFYCLERD